mmetsp:Transcript_13590/g.20541  ORF Transcript_13590/g.20541 Transcript_13590/m.20541 type:complete len:271 (-) Transcript_13590:101-913(-)
MMRLNMRSLGLVFLLGSSITLCSARRSKRQQQIVFGLEDPPVLGYKLDGTVGEYKLEGGVDVKLSSFPDVGLSLWSKTSRVLSGWNVSVRGMMNLEARQRINYDIIAKNTEKDSAVQILANTVNTKPTLNQIQVRQGFRKLGGHIIINPRYTPGAGKKMEGTVVFDRDDYKLQVDGNKEVQSVTCSLRMATGYTITPTVTTKRDFSLSVSKALQGGDSVAATLLPNDSLLVTWKEGPWTVDFRSNVDGFAFDGLTVGVRRKVGFFTAQSK